MPNPTTTHPMTRQPGQLRKFNCDQGEIVTMTFTADNTTFLVVESLNNAANAAVPEVPAGSGAGSFSFTVAAGTTVRITVSFSSEQGAFYEDKISDSHGTTFIDNIVQTSSHPEFGVRDYTFAVRT